MAADGFPSPAVTPPLTALPTLALRSSIEPLHRTIVRRGRGMGDFRRWLQQQGLAENSVKQYVALVRQARAWCRDHGLDLATITSDELGRYVNGRPASWSTRKGIRVALGHYWTFTKRRNPPLWAIRVPRKPRMICRAVDDDLAASYGDIVERALPRREAMAMALMLYQALRREEVARIRFDQFTADGWLIVYGKGGSTDSIPIHPRVRRALRRYLLARDDGSPWLFPGQGDRAHVCPTTIWTWVRRLCEEADLPITRPHQLRHTTLATALDNTGDLRAVQEFARHRRPETTAGYTRATAQRLWGVIAAIEYRHVPERGAM